MDDRAQELDRTMVRIPAGQLVFGMTEREKADAAAQAGVHRDMLHFHSAHRTLTAPEFWIDKYPVTRGQFLRFVRETGYRIPYNGWLVGWRELLGDPLADPDQRDWPMTGVNSDDARAYARWIGKRLPTEVEWEKAARGQDGRLYPWGNAWSDAACFRSPGNLPLGAGFPVGSFPQGASTYGVMDMTGSVLQWVEVVFAPVSRGGGHRDDNRYVLAGSSPLHTQPYTHRVTSRLSWSQGMRIYNGGFRCVSDSRPDGLVSAPAYAPPAARWPRPVSLRADLFLKAPIRLEPLGWATFKIHVPWFPESVWAVDCPEVAWGPFGGANDWPDRPEGVWRIDWEVQDDGRRIRYVREKEGKRLRFEAWADGPAVEYRISGENLGPLNLGSFCFKTFSPFFSSQERMTQNRLEGGNLVRSCDLPLAPDSAVSFGWSVGASLDPGAVVYRSYDGAAYLAFVGEPGVSGSGNGWVPCTHLGGPKRLVEKGGGGRVVFWVGSPDGLRKLCLA